jgi:hypothetical protein
VPSIFPPDFNSLAAFLWGPKRGENRRSTIGKEKNYRGSPICEDAEGRKEGKKAGMKRMKRKEESE